MEKLLSTSLMVSVGKLLTEYMWRSQHFKYTFFLDKNTGEQSLLPTPKLQVPPLLCRAPSLSPIKLRLPSVTEGASLPRADGSKLLLHADPGPGLVMRLVSFHSIPPLLTCGGKITI